MILTLILIFGMLERFSAGGGGGAQNDLNPNFNIWHAGKIFSRGRGGGGGGGREIRKIIPELPQNTPVYMVIDRE